MPDSPSRSSAHSEPALSFIDFRNVTVKRGEKIALDAVDLSIPLGQQVAIIGPNGSGKSTLIKTINRELYPLAPIDDSSLTILGQDRWNVFDLHYLLGIVSNDWVTICTRHITVREAVLTGFFSSAEIWPHNEVTAAMEERAAEILDLLEISHLAARYMTELSTGEGRRVVVGRALVHDPKALILDEPTASLDLHAVHELRMILRKIAQAGTSIILVTHHLPDIIPEISRVVLMKAGRVFRDGAKDEILASAPLSELFGIPVELVRKDGYFHLM
jgi:iron complex transport system ATP-binding protein